jgi:flagellar motor switch protein FliN
MSIQGDAKHAESAKTMLAQAFKQAAQVLSTALRKKVQLALEGMEVAVSTHIAAKYSGATSVSVFSIANDVQGEGLMSLPQSFASVLCTVLTGKPAPAVLTASELGVLSQLMNQLLSSIAASLSQQSGKKLAMQVLETKMSSLSGETGRFAGQPIAVATVRWTVEGSGEEQCVLALPLGLADDMLPTGAMTRNGQRVEALNLSPLERGSNPTGSAVSSLLADIPLQLTVELGRSRMLLKDIMDLGVGSIIELDQLAGEPVEVILNNKPLAKGEVVVIDENLGVRLTQISSTGERI